MATPLELFFNTAWEAFKDGGNGFDGPELQDAIERSGLGYFRPATEEEIQADRDMEYGTLSDVDPGDPIMVLTDAGRKAVTAARADRTGRST